MKLCSAFSLLGAIWLHLCSVSDQKLHRTWKTQSILKYYPKSLKSYRDIGTKNVLMRLIRNYKCKESLQVAGKGWVEILPCCFFYFISTCVTEGIKTKQNPPPLSKPVKQSRIVDIPYNLSTASVTQLHEIIIMNFLQILCKTGIFVNFLWNYIDENKNIEMR